MADPLIVDIQRRFPTGANVDARFATPIQAGAVVVLFGPSGAGKTTVVRAIAGLDRPDRGVIRFGRESWFDAASGLFVEPQARRVGYVFQDGALFPHLTVRANVEYGLGVLDTAERRARVASVLELFDLVELGERRPARLSGGEAQRVALARALAPCPRLLLLDEPFASLDTPTRVHLRKLLRNSVNHLGISCVMVTHDRTEAIALGDVMVVLVDGQVRQTGGVADVFRRPADLAVAQSVGVESVLAARITGVRDGLVELQAGDVTIRAADVGDEGLAEVFACIRAEDVTLEPERHGAGSARNRLSGRVVSVETEGAVERVTVDCGVSLVALITRQAREEMGLEAGSRVTAAVKATAVHVVARS